MPQSSSEQSLVTNIYPVLMGKSDILVKDDFGHTNPLEVGDYTHHHNNRELVNLENASVNIDNSSDVIIGPVTQFNVNGNVTIYQNENGPTSTDGGGDNHDEKTNSYDANLQRKESFQNEEVNVVDTNRKTTVLKIFLCLILASVILTGLTMILLYYLEPSQTQNDKPLVSSPDDVNTTIIKLPHHQFFKRSDWGARSPKWLVNMTTPVNMVIIKHTRSRTCDSFPSCVQVVATQQSQDARDGHPDIYCNFLVGGDGNIYEGRGWGVQPQYRTNTVDIVFIGTYDIDELTPSMTDAVKVLLADGVTRKYLTRDYIIVCHNQTEPNTMSPGQNVFREVKTWPHYDPGIYFDKRLPNYPKQKKQENKAI